MVDSIPSGAYPGVVTESGDHTGRSSSRGSEVVEESEEREVDGECRLDLRAAGMSSGRASDDTKSSVPRRRARS